MDLRSLNILKWNARSLYFKKLDKEIYLQKQHINPFLKKMASISLHFDI